KVPETIIKHTKDREVTAFLDGDRAGDLILKELTQVAEIDYVARAPFGKEVEELTPKEVMRALRERVPLNMAKPIERPQFASRPERTERPYKRNPIPSEPMVQENRATVHLRSPFVLLLRSKSRTYLYQSSTPRKTSGEPWRP